MCPKLDRANLAGGGLTSKVAARILDDTGLNELTVKSAKPAWRLLLAQFNNPVIWMLLAACVISALVGEILDAAAIGTIVVINGLVGFFQEYRAEKAVLALRAMTAPRARVIRDGRTQVIAAAAVVPGDLQRAASEAEVVDALKSTVPAMLGINLGLYRFDNKTPIPIGDSPKDTDWTHVAWRTLEAGTESMRHEESTGYILPGSTGIVGILVSDDPARLARSCPGNRQVRSVQRAPNSGLREVGKPPLFARPAQSPGPCRQKRPEAAVRARQ